MIIDLKIMPSAHSEKLRLKILWYYKVCKSWAKITILLEFYKIRTNLLWYHLYSKTWIILPEWSIFISRFIVVTPFTPLCFYVFWLWMMNENHPFIWSDASFFMWKIGIIVIADSITALIVFQNSVITQIFILLKYSYFRSFFIRFFTKFLFKFSLKLKNFLCPRMAQQKMSLVHA